MKHQRFIQISSNLEPIIKASNLFWICFDSEDAYRSLPVALVQCLWILLIRIGHQLLGVILRQYESIEFLHCSHHMSSEHIAPHSYPSRTPRLLLIYRSVCIFLTFNWSFIIKSLVHSQPSVHFSLSWFIVTADICSSSWNYSDDNYPRRTDGSS